MVSGFTCFSSEEGRDAFPFFIYFNAYIKGLFFFFGQGPFVFGLTSQCFGGGGSTAEVSEMWTNSKFFGGARERAPSKTGDWSLICHIHLGQCRCYWRGHCFGIFIIE